MKISKFDVIIEHQTNTNFIPADKKAYFGGSYKKEDIKYELTNYILGYREASNAIFNKFQTAAKQGHIWVQDTIIYPLIFIHRHCVELELKQFFCLTDTKFNELTQCKIHNLYKLWTRIKSFLIERAERIDKIIDVDAIDHYINVMDSYDEKSYRFRYPMDTKLEMSNVNLELINVETFHKQMNQFHEDMENIFNDLNNQVDDWEVDKNFEDQFMACLKNNYDSIKNILNYKYPELKLPSKTWLSFSQIPCISKEEKEREYQFCQTVSFEVKKIILILFYSLYTLKQNNIAIHKKDERLNDLIKICYNTHSNENIFSNVDSFFWEKFQSIIESREKILSWAEEMISLSNDI